MSRLSVKVTTDLGPLKTTRQALAAGFSRGGSVPPAFVTMRTLWGRRYESFIRRRFDRFSRGGGDWPPLSPRTIRARRPAARHKRARTVTKGRNASKGVGVGRTVSILRNTGTLFGALTIGAAGNAFRHTPGGIAFGFKGGKHPGGTTIAQIAAWHNSGAGNNPRRRILVQPDTVTLKQMRGDLNRAIQQTMRDARGGRGR